MTTQPAGDAGAYAGQAWNDARRELVNACDQYRGAADADARVHALRRVAAADAAVAAVKRENSEGYCDGR